MITMVIPTRNRAHTLRIVAESFFSQELVTEIIFVNDGGTDETAEVIADIGKNYPLVKASVYTNPTRTGASQARNVGAGMASNDYILFCDDDQYLESGYAKTCLNKLKEYNAGAVAGRLVYMRDGETREGALKRFGNGMRRTSLMHYTICETINGATFEGDKKVPFTHAIILTRKDLLLQFPFDSYYATGNGYREETDYQMNLFVNGYDIYVTNDTHTVHLPFSQVKTGGQRVKKMTRIYWSVFYTKYFFDKYYVRYAARIGLKTPKIIALAMFTVFIVYRETIRPFLYDLAMGVLVKVRKSA